MNKKTKKEFAKVFSGLWASGFVIVALGFALLITGYDKITATTIIGVGIALGIASDIVFLVQIEKSIKK